MQLGQFQLENTVTKTEFSITKNPDYALMQSLIDQDNQHPHIHAIDMPFRLTSTWQEHGCEVGMWKQGATLAAWAIFQPAWWNVDYAIHSSMVSASLEADIFAWGQAQMQQYANRTGEAFWGSVELFADAPHAQNTVQHLENTGFTKFDWSTLRFTLDLGDDLPLPQMPDGFRVRPLQGRSEVDRYVTLHRAAFGSDKMTASWRARTLAHPAYRPELDLVVVNSADIPIGFCICWLRQNSGQIEPLGILPDYQGKGLGRALELTAAHTLKTHGASAMHIDHTSFNEAAIALSQETGFKQSNDALRYYVDISPSR